MKILVIDFGGTLAKYSVMDEDGTVLISGEESAPTSSKDAFLCFVRDLLAHCSESIKISGIAISMPGAIDAETGFIKTAGAYTALYGIHLYDALKEYVSVPVTVENDGKRGALAEVWRGNLADCQDGIVIILGTGIAGGIIKDRKVHRGSDLSAGEFSFMLLGDRISMNETALCKCSTSALLFEAMRRKGIDVRKHQHYWMYGTLMNTEQTLSELDRDPAYNQGMSGYQFFSLLESGDSAIQNLYDEYLGNLSLLIYNLQLAFSPEKVLIGGGISRQPRLIGDIRTHFSRISGVMSPLFTVNSNIHVCRFGNEANQFGALYNFIRSKC